MKGVAWITKSVCNESQFFQNLNKNRNAQKWSV